MYLNTSFTNRTPPPKSGGRRQSHTWVLSPCLHNLHEGTGREAHTSVCPSRPHTLTLYTDTTRFSLPTLGEHTHILTSAEGRKVGRRGENGLKSMVSDPRQTSVK